MDLFDLVREKNLKKESPLADRMRPEKLEDFVGQGHIAGNGKLLYRAIKSDRLSSAILYGPTGSGKTTLAKIIANTTKNYFVELNAVTSGKGDIVKIIDEARQRISMGNKRTVLFIDEIHRFNKLQQDALLPYVENGTLIMIGATTENPYFEVNRALLSRSMIFKLEPLSIPDIKAITKRALQDDQNGLGMYKAQIEDKALDYIANFSNGDARNALNAIEIAVLTTTPNEKGEVIISLDTAVECIQKKAIGYDKAGDFHYDTISAFIKSMRGSDPDAAVYYLARMIESGEDIRFIARRIVICASEDVGNADPNAIVVANSAAQASDFVGLPEARIILSQAAIYVACAPKSNACYNAINSAIEDADKIQIKEIPAHLRGTGYSGDKELGNGIGYKYAHDYNNHYVAQQYLPDELLNKKYYFVSDQGYEKNIKKWLNYIKSDEQST